MTAPLRLLTIVGARPQIIKAAALSRAIAASGTRIVQTILHTGQHYDPSMSQVFFDQLGLPAVDVNLGVGPGTPEWQVARMTDGIAEVLSRSEHDVALVFGDTNTTLAGALAATKLRMPVAHVEAGLRSFNKTMPEETNRIACDHCSTWLFCPTETAVNNLAREGFDVRRTGTATMDAPIVQLTGDVMFDNSLYFADRAREGSTVLSDLGVETGKYMLATMHRAANTDDPARLGAIMEALCDMAKVHHLPVILPMHPRTRDRIEASLPTGLRSRIAEELKVVPPSNFLDMIVLESNARILLTDSGGVQKEAYFFRRPCVVLREETEWVELVHHGQARLAGADPVAIAAAVAHYMNEGMPPCPDLYGDGHAADRICETLLS